MHALNSVIDFIIEQREHLNSLRLGSRSAFLFFNNCCLYFSGLFKRYLAYESFKHCLQALYVLGGFLIQTCSNVKGPCFGQTLTITHKFSINSSLVGNTMDNNNLDKECQYYGAR